MVIKWLTPAKKSIKGIVVYYKEKHAENTAKKIVAEITASVDKLKKFPELAAIEPLLENRTKPYRSLVATKTYKIIYYIEAEIVYIAEIWDCRQNPDKLKKITP